MLATTASNGGGCRGIPLAANYARPMPSSRLLASVFTALVVMSACSDSGSSATSTSSPSTATSVSSAPATSSSSSSTSGTVIDLVVAGGEVQGGVQTKEVLLGSAVTLRVTSDVADEVHVHGYDKKGDVEAGSDVTITFTADIPGEFEVELENAHMKLVELRVS